MVRACVVVAGIALLVGPAHEARAQAPPVELKIGLPKPMFKDVPAAMVTAAAKPFQTMIQKMAGLNGSVHVVPDYKALANDMKAGKIDIGVFHGFEYAWVKDTPGLVPLVVTVPNCGKVQACLVVHKDAKHASSKDLKGSCVLMPKGSKAHCHMYLDHLREKLPAGDCCPMKAADLTAQEALAEVATEAAEAAIVDVSALIALENSYPGCFKQLRVLSRSELLPSAVVVYRKDSIDANTVNKVRKGLIDCVNTPIGKTFALFWQLKGFEDVGPAYNTQLEQALKAYPNQPEPPAAEPQK